MKTTAFTNPADMVAALGLGSDGEKAIFAILEEQEVQTSERIEFDVEVDEDDVYDQLEKKGAIPEPDIEEVVDLDDLADAVRAAVDGDRPMAMILFGRALGTDTSAARRIEEILRGAPSDHPTLPLLAAA